MVACSNFPVSSSGGDVWERWHRNLVKCVGKERAADLFIRLWEKRAGISAAASTIQLRTYLRDEAGIELSVDRWKKTSDFFSGVGEFIGGGFSALGTGMKIVWYGLIGVLVIGALGLVYTIFVNPDKAARIGSAVATRGKSEMIGGGIKSGRKAVAPPGPKMIDVKAK